VQSIWDKVWCYWEHIEEHNENLRNLMGRHWEQERTNLPSHQEHPKLKPWTPWVHVTLPHWLRSTGNCYSYACCCHHFQPRLMCGTYNWGVYCNIKYSNIQHTFPLNNSMHFLNLLRSCSSNPTVKKLQIF
jgi:hypothetical protein